MGPSSSTQHQEFKSKGTTSARFESLFDSTTLDLCSSNRASGPAPSGHLTLSPNFSFDDILVGSSTTPTPTGIVRVHRSGEGGGLNLFGCSTEAARGVGGGTTHLSHRPVGDGNIGDKDNGNDEPRSSSNRTPLSPGVYIAHFPPLLRKGR